MSFRSQQETCVKHDQHQFFKCVVMVDSEVRNFFTTSVTLSQAQPELRFIDVKKKTWTLLSLCSRLSLDVALYVAHCDGKNYGPFRHLLHILVYSCHALMYSVL